MFRRIGISLIAVASTVCAACAQAPGQPAPPAMVPPPSLGAQAPPAFGIAPGPPPPPGVPGLPPGPPPAFAATPLTGVIKSYLLNPGGQVDGLLLSDGKQLHSPPHLGQALQQAAKPGDSVQATVEPGNQSQYGQEYRTISLTNPKTGATVVDQPPLYPPPPPAPGQALSAAGRVIQWLVGHMGEVNGFVLSDGAQVHFPPPMGFALNQQMRVGDSVSVQGYGTRTAFGTSLDLTAMTVNGKSISMYGVQP